MRFNRSEPGLILSSAAHAALLATMVIGLWSPRAFSDHQESIPVEMVTEEQLAQAARGEREAKEVRPDPQPRAERVAENRELKPEAPVAPRDVEAPAAPAPAAQDSDGEVAERRAAEAKARADAQAKAEADAKAAAERAAAQEQARQIVAAAAAERARQAAAEQAQREAEAKAAAEAEEERKQAEEERQRKAAEARKAAEERARREADAKALRERIEREQREEEQRKAAEAERARRAAEAKRVADERARKAAEDKKAADEKAKRDAEAQAAAARRIAEQKPFNPTEIDRLLQNRQPAQSTGSAAPQQQRQASLGSPTGQAPRMTSSDREALIEFLRSRMRECISVPPGANRNARPEVRVILARDGSLAAPPAIVGGDPVIGAAAARGIRACAPYRIPQRFQAQYEDWRALLITIDASDLN